LEEAADRYVETRTGLKHVIVKNLGRHTMLKPSHAATLLPDQTFKLGDRVVFVQDSGTVPIGAKGTVVGLDRLEVEVVFDDRFMSGMDLSGRCSMHRGMTVGPQSILNLSNPQCNLQHTPTPAVAAPRPKPVAILPKPAAKAPEDHKPPGWEILGVAPPAEPQKSKTGGRQAKVNSGGPSAVRPIANHQARPTEQSNVNQSLGFLPRPRPVPQIAVRPGSENNKPGAEDISAILLGLLHKNVPAGESPSAGIASPAHRLPVPVPAPHLPAAGSHTAALLQHLRPAQPRPPQQQPRPPQAWQGPNPIQQQHQQQQQQRPHHGGHPGQRGGAHRQPRPPQATGNHAPKGSGSRGGHRGGHTGHQGQPRPTTPADNAANAGGANQETGATPGSPAAGANSNNNVGSGGNRRGRARGANRGGPKTPAADGAASSTTPAATAAPAPALSNNLVKIQSDFDFFFFLKNGKDFVLCAFMIDFLHSFLYRQSPPLHRFFSPHLSPLFGM